MPYRLKVFESKIQKGIFGHERNKNGEEEISQGKIKLVFKAEIKECTFHT
jgi:hypothetical protein